MLPWDLLTGPTVYETIGQLDQESAVHIIVQSSHKDPHYLDQRVELFLTQFRGFLADCAREDPLKLGTYLQAVSEKLTEKPKNINQVQ